MKHLAQQARNNLPTQPSFCNSLSQRRRLLTTNSVAIHAAPGKELQLTFCYKNKATQFAFLINPLSQRQRLTSTLTAIDSALWGELPQPLSFLTKPNSSLQNSTSQRQCCTISILQRKYRHHNQEF
jgi:hypothetical protein